MIASLLRKILAVAAGLAALIFWLLTGVWQWPAMAAAPAAIAAVLLAYAVFLGIEFALTAWLGRACRPPAEARLVHCGGPWRAWLAEFPVAVRAFAWDMSFRSTPALPSGRSMRKVPVLLVHGYLCNRAVFRTLAADLAAAGHPVAGVDLEPPFDSIDRFTALIEASAQTLMAASRVDRVALVGHSMGGLAVRAWLRDYGDRHMHAVVTLGTPHQGTLLARVGHTPIVRQMQPGSAWLDGLAAGETPGRTRRFTIVSTAHDNIVVPQFPQRLPGARQYVFHGLGHLHLTCHPRVRSLVVSLLSAPVCEASAISDGSDRHDPNPRPDADGPRGSPAPASPGMPG